MVLGYSIHTGEQGGGGQENEPRLVTATAKLDPYLFHTMYQLPFLPRIFAIGTRINSPSSIALSANDPPPPFYTKIRKYRAYKVVSCPLVNARGLREYVGINYRGGTR